MIILSTNKDENIRKSYQPNDDISDGVELIDNDTVSDKSDEIKINVECLPEIGGIILLLLIKAISPHCYLSSLLDSKDEARPIASNMADYGITEVKIMITISSLKLLMTKKSQMIKARFRQYQIR